MKFHPLREPGEFQNAVVIYCQYSLTEKAYPVRDIDEGIFRFKREVVANDNLAAVSVLPNCGGELGRGKFEN